MRSVNELAQVDDPAWPHIQNWLGNAASAQALPVSRDLGEACLYELQVSAKSTLGALALHTGGVLVNNGFLRLLGGGGAGLPSIVEASATESVDGCAAVARDVIGGTFVINLGGLDGDPGEVFYWAPDTLEWEPLGFGHPVFVEWALSSAPDTFYADYRWDGWESEIAAVGLEAGIAFYPPLFTEQGWPLERTTRSAVPWTELIETR